MFIDNLLVLDPSGTAITSAATSTNTIDFGVARDMGIGDDPLWLVCQVNTSFVGSGAALQVQIQTSPDNSAYASIVQSPMYYIASVTGNTTSGSNQIASVSSTTNLVIGQTVTGTGIPSNSIITGISGSTVTISNNATATGTGVALLSTFLNANQELMRVALPLGNSRYLRLNYSVANGPFTAGALQAFLTLDRQANVAYAEGINVSYV